jgi:glycogen debranching enzyme
MNSRNRVGDVLAVDNEYYVRATSGLADHRTRVLKYGDTFAVFNRYGDIEALGPLQFGLFHSESRHISRMVLYVNDRQPQLLGSTVRQDTALLAVDLTNLDETIGPEGQQAGPLQRGMIHIFRSSLLDQATCHQLVRLINYGSEDVSVSLTLHFDADFVDIFEVRGSKRERRGEILPAQIKPQEVLLSYRGLDDVVRGTRLHFWRVPESLGVNEARFTFHLEPKVEQNLVVDIFCERSDSKPLQSDSILQRSDSRPFDSGHLPAVTLSRAGAQFPVGTEMPANAASPAGTGSPGGTDSLGGTPLVAGTTSPADTPLSARLKTLSSLQSEIFRTTRVVTSSDRLNAWIARSGSDLRMLTEGNPEGQYPYAGVPWFSTVFGRDGIITAMECLWIAPTIARGVLGYLAHTQATRENLVQDAEPGKIIHEIRRGEMAVLGEVPFGQYYGSVDATPLFVMLVGEYFQRTNDVAFVKEIWPYVEAALAWMERYGDADGDGYVEYRRMSPRGLLQQGWKDSHDSIFQADGRIAEPPIALCEVQGYVFAAKLAAARLCAALDLPVQATKFSNDAAALKKRFNEDFWCEELGTFALALDGNKKPCRVSTSNAGHALFAGIAAPEYAEAVCKTMLSPSLFSGWGVRTVSSTEKRYNPMSYHNGSVWPHDNAIVGYGFARYGMNEKALQVLTAMFDASSEVDLHRLPELFCGFHRRENAGAPILYPVACAPQAWAAGAVYLLLCACLGMKIDAAERYVQFENPQLPSGVSEMEIRGLQVGEAHADLLIRRHSRGIDVEVLEKHGQLEVTKRI